MMKSAIKTSLFAIGVLAAIPVFAAPPAAMPPAAPAASPEPPPPRDPFWPVGFTPVPEKVIEIKKKQEEIKKLAKWPRLEVAGTFKGPDGKYMATIRKFGIVEEGDVISAKKDGLIYRWRINKITSTGISTTRLKIRELNGALQKHTQ